MQFALKWQAYLDVAFRLQGKAQAMNALRNFLIYLRKSHDRIESKYCKSQTIS